MVSLKTSLRRTIAATMASVMITTVFVGCAGDTNTSLVDTSTSTTASTTVSTSELTNELTPGTTDTDSVFSIKYKYWYDSEYTKEQQDSTLSTKAGDSNKFLFDLEGLPIHTDDDGNEYIVSGRTEITLADGKLPLINLSALRTEGEGEDGGGQRVYVVNDTASTTKELEEYDTMLEVNGIVPPTSIEERQTADTLADEKTAPEGLTIYVNNLITDYTTANDMIDISAIYNTVSSLGVVSVPDDTQAAVTMITAAGIVTANFIVTDSSIEVTYSTEKDKAVLTFEEVSLADSTIQIAPDALERVLGYDVEIYDTHINIVTDNRDIFTPNTIVPQDTVMDSTPTDPIADQIAQEREDSIPMATDEQIEQIQQDKQDRQDLADDTSAYTTDGIPLTTDGGLTEPAKPTANYKLPDGAQLEFTGDPDTAIYTELPDGCYWRPTGSYPNAFMDPAGNLWCNNQFDLISNRGMGYLTPDGSYHASQEEIDEHIRFEAATDAVWENGPTAPSDIKISDEGRQTLDDLLGI